jgi:hypothetical protein
LALLFVFVAKAVKETTHVRGDGTDGPPLDAAPA